MASLMVNIKTISNNGIVTLTSNGLFNPEVDPMNITTDVLRVEMFAGAGSDKNRLNFTWNCT